MVYPKVIVCQAVLSAVLGLSVAALIGAGIVQLTVATALPIVITPGLIAGLLSAHRRVRAGRPLPRSFRVTRRRPSTVFTR